MTTEKADRDREKLTVYARSPMRTWNETGAGLELGYTFTPLHFPKNLEHMRLVYEAVRKEYEGRVASVLGEVRRAKQSNKYIEENI